MSYPQSGIESNKLLKLRNAEPEYKQNDRIDVAKVMIKREANNQADTTQPGIDIKWALPNETISTKHRRSIVLEIPEKEEQKYKS